MSGCLRFGVVQLEEEDAVEEKEESRECKEDLEIEDEEKEEEIFCFLLGVLLLAKLVGRFKPRSVLSW